MKNSEFSFEKNSKFTGSVESSLTSRAQEGRGDSMGRKANQAEDGEHSSHSLKTKNPELAEIIDIQAIQSLMEDFYKLVHIPIGLHDLKGNVLVGIGWQDICTKFHRVHPQTCRHCIESNINLCTFVPPGEFKLYRCKNNMWDVATPIMVEGQQVGSVFAGQFFFDDEPLDYELFQSQARRYGFNEDEYLAALEKVPRLSREALNTGMAFFMTFANVISYLSYSNIKLARSLDERDVLVDTLRKSEEKYRSIVETANEGIWRSDTKRRTTYANQKMAEMLGYSQEEIIGRSVWDLTGEEDDPIIKLNREKRQQGIDESKELKFRCKDGTFLWALVNTKSFFDQDGKFTGSLGMLTDITTRKKMEEALKEAYDNLENLVEKRTVQLEKAYKSLKESQESLAEAQRIAHIGNWEWEVATDKAHWSEEMYSIFGLNPQESAPGIIEFLNYIHPEDRGCIEKIINKRSEGFLDGIDYRIIQANGEERTVYTQAEAIFSEKGFPIRVKGIVQDITERKKSEEKIQRLANIVESSNDAIITESLDGIISSWNKGAEQVYGYLAEEVLGRSISIIEPDNLKGEIKQLTDEVKQGKKIQNYETSRLKKDGTIINVSVTLSPIFDQSGKFIAISSIAGDITEKKVAEKLLQEKQMAEVANRTKNDFLAKISHELRTPLNSIIGFSDMLYEQAYGDLNEKQLRSVGNISKSGKHLLGLINNILDISKIEAGKMELVYKNFELATKLNIIRNILFPIANKKNIKIVIDMDSKLTTICADEDKFVQIMYNLMDNAIKFSYENSLIKIGARKKVDLVEITVADAGIGIKVEDQYKLFKPFSRIYSFSSKKTQGTGLGLSLIKQIVHLHGGYVWFRSNPGEGSTFAFAIPINYKSPEHGAVRECIL